MHRDYFVLCLVFSSACGQHGSRTCACRDARLRRRRCAAATAARCSRSPTRRQGRGAATRSPTRSIARSDEILEANARDLEAGRENGLSRRAAGPARARPTRGSRRWPRGVRKIAALPDPVGEVIDGYAAAERARRAQGARAAGSRRGRLRGAAQRHDRRRGAVPEVGQRDRAARLELRRALQRRAGERRRRGGDRGGPARRRDVSWSPAAAARSWPSWPPRTGVVDLIIPRGGEGLKAALKGVATVPVIYAASGNCHVYVDATADLEAAARDHPQRQAPAPGRVQRGRDAARPRRRGRRVPARDAARAARRRRRAARRRPRAARAAPGVDATGGDRATTGTPSTWRSSSRSAWSTPPRRRSPTSTRTAAATPRRS